MYEVLVQIWGPAEASGCIYSWVNVNKIINPESMDLLKLKQRVLETIDSMEIKPNTNIARIKVLWNGKPIMKVIYTDLW